MEKSSHLFCLTNIKYIGCLYFMQTIESTLRESAECVRSYVASLNFVDLAGSERASQTNADGARLREGCHINLSLMTLTTVIRKLSVGKRSGHIPYRDSKLGHILQHSLGGNARTAIICTLSPASSHVEQTTNTLLFATRAKEVTNSAQENMMEMEIEELRRQRDLAQTEVDDLRRKLQEDQRLKISELSSPVAKKCLSFSAVLSPMEGKELGRGNRNRNTMGRKTMRQSSTAPFTLMHEIRKLEHLQEQLGDEANRALEILQKEVACHRLGNQDAAETIAKLLAEIREILPVRPAPQKVEVSSGLAVNKSVSANLKDEITRLHSLGSTIADLEEQLENVQKSIDKLVMSLPTKNDHQEADTESPLKTKTQAKKKKLLPLASSNAANRQNFLSSPCSPLSATKDVVDNDIENRAPQYDDVVSTETKLTEKETPTKSEDGGDVSSK
ncbi:OLC1v1014233C2 [Oldenlandia corymbosa var. corymbosa]|uniref:Kinesin-like protein n=1 Tax=Oldenlandia corymbosa var. corymbosa TaxID=529605 RepID=A0AAV1E0C6_OLDCO|nr:OLC1v1014233C2 [Oldenlandia corymbosa var. corymbosa]